MSILKICRVPGAEEKVLRAFSATKNFVHNFRRLTGIDLASADEVLRLPEGASVAALGLSNKAVYESDLKSQGDCNQSDNPKDNQEDFYFRPIELSSPPNEETLAQNTLWHEVRKLYGHGLVRSSRIRDLELCSAGRDLAILLRSDERKSFVRYELYAVASSPDGSIVASACKAQSVKHAFVILWDTKEWRIIQKLEHHQLTVTKIAFSKNGNQILTVSRDRTWALWEKSENDYVKVYAVSL